MHLWINFLVWKQFVTKHLSCTESDGKKEAVSFKHRKQNSVLLWGGNRVMHTSSECMVACQGKGKV